MIDSIAILETLVSEVRAGRPVALCVVLKTHGSTPQTPGAMMLVRGDGGAVGTVGGGAVEAEIQRDAAELVKEGRSLQVDLSLEGGCSLDGASICGGRMSVGIMTVGNAAEAEPFAAALEAVRQRRAAQIPVVVEHQGKRLEYRVSLEVPPTLVIAGAGHVGQALARLVVEIGFRVVVVDDRAEFASRERFGERVELAVGDITETLRDYQIDATCYIAIATRGHAHDQRALDVVVRRPAAYIGMIGSRRKSAAVLENLAKAGVPRELLDRVHTPIGFSIGAVTVNEIAVSIAAELIQVRRKAAPRAVEGPAESRQ